MTLSISSGLSAYIPPHPKTITTNAPMKYGHGNDIRV